VDGAHLRPECGKWVIVVVIEDHKKPNTLCVHLQWIGLFFPKHSIYVDSLRECYEAYVIYNFMVYLLNYLNLGMDLEATMEYKPQVPHFFPLCCMRPWVMGREFIHNCKHGILQYTVVRPITTFISV